MADGQQRQYLKYSFYKVDPAWRRLPHRERAGGAAEFLAVAQAYQDEMMLRSYNLQGTRADVDFLLWQVTTDLDAIQESAARLANTGLGAYLNTAYSYLSMTKHSPYIVEHRHPEQEGTGLTVRPRGAKYFFVYPFLKTRAWYRLPKDDRQKMMNEHFTIGHRYPTVKITTSYSFGLDDQEFVLGFETEKPEDFLDLVQDLRETEASTYTLRDTPIFTCVNTHLKDILDSLVGEPERVAT